MFAFAFMVVMLFVSQQASATSYTISKSGSATDFSTWDALIAALNNHASKTDTILLASDLDITGVIFENPVPYFQGVFDGQNHTISGTTIFKYPLFKDFSGKLKNIVFDGITCEVNDDYEAALLTLTADDATFDNVTLKNCSMEGKGANDFGFFAGIADKCTFNYCSVATCYMDITGGNKDGQDEQDRPSCGVIVGYTESSNYLNCHESDANLYMDDYAGGIVGVTCLSCEFANCSFAGKLQSTYFVGGIVGQATNGCNIHDCINSGHIYGYTHIGGIVGGMDETTGAEIVNCTNKGYIEYRNKVLGSNEYFGGIAGYFAGDIINCTNEGNIDGYNSTGGIVGFKQYNTVKGCINKGSVSGNNYVGDLIGHLQGGGTMKYCINMSSGSANNACIGTIEDDCTATDYFWLDNNSSFSVDNAQRKSGISSTLLKSGYLAYYVSSLAGEKVWGQTMNPDGTNVDEYPTPNAPVVYFHNIYTNCKSDNKTAYYNNLSSNHYGETQIDASGKYLCSYCGKELDYSSAENIYKISNSEDLLNFSTNIVPNHPDACAILTSDINWDGLSPWTPIGTTDIPYKGTFNGQNHEIKDLTYASTDGPAGIFGCLGNGAVIRNLFLYSSNISATGAWGAAGIAGCVSSTSGTCNVTIMNCGNASTISGNTNIAGILGGVYYNDDTNVTIKNCYNTGDINGTTESAAICGFARKNFDIENCWNTGTVTGYTEGMYFVRHTNEGTRTFTNNYSSTGTQTDVTSINKDDLASGKLCWMLNGGDEGDGTNNNGWYQNLEKNSYPTFVACEDAAIYKNLSRYCNEESYSIAEYSNVKKDKVTVHEYDSDGFCKRISGETHYKEPISNSDATTYYVSLPSHLYWLAENINNGTISCPNIELTATIFANRSLYDDGSLVSDCSDKLVWTPIGTAEHPYIGKTFNGNGNIISGLYLPESANAVYAGLFGVAYKNATIKNVGISSSYICAGTDDGTHYAGAIVGCGVNPDDLTETTGAVIQNCYSGEGDVIGNGWTGGIAGYLNLGADYSSNLLCLYSTFNTSTKNTADKEKTGALFGYLGTATEGESYSGDLSSCFYQTGKTKGSAEYGVKKSEYAFKYGEVCSLLNKNRQSDMLSWSQALEYADLLSTPYFGNDSVCYHRSISNEWGTIMVPFNLTSNDDITFYSASSIDDDHSLYLKKEKNIAPNTPCFFHVNDGTTEISLKDLDLSSVAPEKTELWIENNGMLTVGSYVEKEVKTYGVDVNYYIANGKMWLGEEKFTLPAFRAYIQLVNNGSKARSLTIYVSDGSEATAIGEISADGALRFYDGPAYNLAGQRLSSPAKGQVNIMNGKKVMVK